MKKSYYSIVSNGRVFLISFLLTFLCSLSGQAQLIDKTKGLITKMFADTADASEPKFIAYPTLAYSPETRWEVGVSALRVHYAKKDTTNRLSELKAFAFYTQNAQFGLWMDHALYTNRNVYFLLGENRFQRFPLLYYGIGPNTGGEELAEITGTEIWIRERLLRRVHGSFFVGLEFESRRLTNVDYNSFSEGDIPQPFGSTGAKNTGLGLGLVFDQRHNVLNVRHGLFAEGGFLIYRDHILEEHAFNRYFFDVRHYTPVTEQQVLAFQLIGTHSEGNVPFHQLGLLGGENVMRGYYLGRYRDNTYLAAQAEYRFLPFWFSKRFGGAAFIGAGGVSPSPKEIDLGNWKVAGGLGIRFLLFPKKDIFTRFDVGMTEDGMGYYFFIGEAF